MQEGAECWSCAHEPTCHFLPGPIQLLNCPTATKHLQPTTSRFGDIHYYNYSADCMDPATYPPAKFVSEWGVQSAPSFASVAPYTAPPDWSPFSPGAVHRWGLSGAWMCG